MHIEINTVKTGHIACWKDAFENKTHKTRVKTPVAKYISTSFLPRCRLFLAMYSVSFIANAKALASREAGLPVAA